MNHSSIILSQFTEAKVIIYGPNLMAAAIFLSTNSTVCNIIVYDYHSTAIIQDNLR